MVCVQEGSGFCNDQSLAENFYVVTQHGCAVLLSKDTFEPNFSCVLLFIPCKLSNATWGRRGRGCYWLVPQSYIDKSCSYLTVANVHINNECEQRRSVCIALLLLIRDLCLKLGAVVLTSDFNKGAERELSLVAPRASAAFSREAAFSSTLVPWPTFGGGGGGGEVYAAVETWR